MKLFGLKPIYWLLIFVFGLHVFVAALPQNNLAWDEAYYVPMEKDAVEFHGI